MTSTLAPQQARHLQVAHGLWQKGKLDEAEAILRPIIASAPGDASAHHLYGLILQSSGKIAAALAALELACKHAPQDIEILNSLGLAYAESGDGARAKVLYAALLQKHPRHINAYLNWADTEARSGDTTAALEILQRAASIDPLDARIWLGVGDVHQQIGTLEKAVQAYELALKASPNLAVAHHSLGLTYAALHDLENAITQYGHARKAGLVNPALDYNEAVTLSRQGDFYAATELMRRVSQADPDNIQAHILQADYGWQAGIYASPCSSIIEAAQRLGSQSPLYRAAIKRTLQARAFHEALNLIECAPKALQVSPEFSAARANILSETGDFKAADEIYDGLHAFIHQSGSALSTYARHLLKKGKPELAELACQSALLLEPDLQIAQSYLGVAWRMQNDPREYWLHDYDTAVFSVPLTVPENYRDLPDFLATLRKLLSEFHNANKAPVDQSVRGGTQTLEHLFTRRNPEISQLRLSIEKVLNAIFSKMTADPTHPFLRRIPRGENNFIFSGAWSVQLAAQGYHLNHMHNEGWLSSACYISLPSEMTSAAENNHEGWLQLGSPPAEMGLDLPPRRLVKPVPGNVVLFPSSMWHGTLPFQSNTPRLSVAFDVIPK
jgi:tetratricopeptide (TPR) repeat protein